MVHFRDFFVSVPVQACAVCRVVGEEEDAVVALPPQIRLLDALEAEPLRYRRNRSRSGVDESRNVRAASRNLERLQVDEDQGEEPAQNNLASFRRILREQQETIEELLDEQKKRIPSKSLP